MKPPRPYLNEQLHGTLSCACCNQGTVRCPVYCDPDTQDTCFSPSLLAPGLGFRGLGFGGLGFRGLGVKGFRVEGFRGSGFGVSLELVQGLGLGVHDCL